MFIIRLVSSACKISNIKYLSINIKSPTDPAVSGVMRGGCVIFHISHWISHKTYFSPYFSQYFSQNIFMRRHIYGDILCFTFKRVWFLAFLTSPDAQEVIVVSQ